MRTPRVLRFPQGFTTASIAAFSLQCPHTLHVELKAWPWVVFDGFQPEWARGVTKVARCTSVGDLHWSHGPAGALAGW